MKLGRSKWGLLGVAAALVFLAVIPWIGGTSVCTDPSVGQGQCTTEGPFMGVVGAATWTVLCTIAAALTGWRAFTGPRHARRRH